MIEWKWWGSRADTNRTSPGFADSSSVPRGTTRAPGRRSRPHPRGGGSGSRLRPRPARTLPRSSRGRGGILRSRSASVGRAARGGPRRAYVRGEAPATDSGCDGPPSPARYGRGVGPRRAASSSSAARSPLRIAPAIVADCPVVSVTSPAKKRRPSNGAASAWRSAGPAARQEEGVGTPGPRVGGPPMDGRPLDRPKRDPRGHNRVPLGDGRRDHGVVIEPATPARLAPDGERRHDLPGFAEADPRPVEARGRVAPQDPKVPQTAAHRASPDHELKRVGIPEPQAVDRRELVRWERRVRKRMVPDWRTPRGTVTRTYRARTSAAGVSGPAPMRTRTPFPSRTTSVTGAFVRSRSPRDADAFGEGRIALHHPEVSKSERLRGGRFFCRWPEDANRVRVGGVGVGVEDVDQGARRPDPRDERRGSPSGSGRLLRTARAPRGGSESPARPREFPPPDSAGTRTMDSGRPAGRLRSGCADRSGAGGRKGRPGAPTRGSPPCDRGPFGHRARGEPREGARSS